MTMLLASDQHDSALLLVALEALPCQLVVVRDGKEALLLIELLSESGPEAALTSVLLDLHTSRPDGADVVKTMRQQEALAGIPVVLLTSPEQQSAGATRRFRKPTDQESLAELRQVIQVTLLPVSSASVA